MGYQNYYLFRCGLCADFSCPVATMLLTHFTDSSLSELGLGAPVVMMKRCHVSSEEYVSTIQRIV